MVTLLLSISFYGNLTIIDIFYGNLTMELESFLDTCL